ncbi:mechanosensitive ion channel [Brevibacterium sp. 5221]|uniref:Mechanosensitive ion channel n=1 Tax=Brevibacterium rongguiense TaxID=2695267 RepID=A0A6N9H6A2_9MICO|nr:mechanosensitive ion channel family protein [Brevibacterium rongguiense]MYM19590.1 mechanosensitive ion channel [Brevibacterium rongguiense]
MTNDLLTLASPSLPGSLSAAAAQLAAINWEFILGTPLRIAIVIVVAVLINIVLRKAIRNFAHKIADGTTAVSRRRFSSSGADEQQVEPARHRTEARADEETLKRRAQRARTVGSMLSSFATIIVFIIASLFVLQELGFDPTPILASAGVAGVAIGFGAQSLVKDYLSGFFIVVEDQYGIGDSVDLGEAIGVVEGVGLRITKVRGSDGTLWHVRNGEILRVGNQSQGWARAVMDIPMPYNASQTLIDEIVHTAIANLRKSPTIGPDIIEDPEVLGVQELTGTSMTIRTLIKTKPNQQWAVARAYRAEIKRQLDRRGIAIALPEQTVLTTMPDPVQAAATAPSSTPTDGDTAGDGA